MEYFSQNLPQSRRFSKQFLSFNNLDPHYFLKINPKIIHRLGISQLVLSKINPDDLRKLVQSLKSIKFLQNLKLRLGGCNPEDLKKVINQLRAIKGIQSLKIDFLDYEHKSLEELMTLPRKTARGRKLRELDVNFSSKGGRLPESFGRLPYLFLKVQPRLESLSLKFKSLDVFSKRDLVLLSKRLQKGGPSLKNLKLKFDWGSEVHLDGLSELTSKGLRNLPNLKSFSLNLEWSCPPDYNPSKGFSGSSLNLLKTKDLVDFKLNLLGWKSIPTKDFELLAAQFKDWSLSLKSLVVKFPSGEYIEAKDLRIFTESLGYLKSLKRLKFVMSPDEEESLSHEMIQSLAKGLERLEGLENLYLVLTYLNLQNKDVEVLLKGIQGKHSLKNLELDLWGNSEITDEGVNEIFSHLKELEKLEGLVLDLEGCEANSSNISTLAAGVEKLKELKSFQLRLDNLEKGTDFGVLLGGLGTLPKLSSLHLTVISFKITGQDLLQISSGLKKMNSLQTLFLYLDFDVDSILWREEFETFFDRLKKIPALTNFRIYMESTNNNCLEALWTQLKRWKNLDSLFLCFGEGGTLSEKAAEGFYQAMETLRGLKNFAMYFSQETLIPPGSALKLLKGVEELNCVENLEFNLRNVWSFKQEDRDSQEDWIEGQKRLLEKLVKMKSLKKYRFKGHQII